MITRAGRGRMILLRLAPAKSIAAQGIIVRHACPSRLRATGEPLPVLSKREALPSIDLRCRIPAARRGRWLLSGCTGRTGPAARQPSIGRNEGLRRRKAACWEPRVEIAGTEAGGGFTVGLDEDSVGFLHLLANRLGSGVDGGSR